MVKTITKDELIQILDYNAETGIFIRRSNGKIVGSINAAGYLTCCIKKKHFYLHRLAWIYVHGNVPPFIDHINGIKGDNRIQNLRPVTKSQNGMNRSGTYAKSGYRWVYYQSNTSKWRVKVSHLNVGYFDSKQEAALAAKEAAKSLYGEYVV